MASALPCEVAAICGGCPLMGQSRDAELTQKAQLVEGALRALEVPFPALRWQFVGEPLGYRNRLRLRVHSDGSVAFFNPHKAFGCAVLEPGLADVVARVRAFADQQPERLRSFAHLEVRAPDALSQSGICFYPKSQAEHGVAPAIDGAMLVAIAPATNPATVPRQRLQIAADVACLVPLDAFMQVNTRANRALVASLRALCQRQGVRSFVDLFAGAGNLSLPLLRAGMSGKIVERSASAIQAFRAACAEQELDPAGSIAGDAEDVSASWSQSGFVADLVVIDAPRAGVKRGITAMAALAEHHVAVCSCNPQTLARDLRALVELGFSIREILLFDMFPQTRHVEVLAWLDRLASS